jgi:glycosyltransferase involved in cell wall biosynthesis
LRRNLASVDAQTYPNLEHVVMDGGSSDATIEILRAAHNVRWRSEPDGGQSHALNKALAESSGEIIGWLNADDAYFTREAVETAVAAFEAHPTAAVVYGHAALVDSEDRLLHYLWVPPYSRWLLRRYNYIFQPSAFIRRSAVEDSFIDETYESWMDRELWLRLAERRPFNRIDRIVAIDRHHSMRKSYRSDLAEEDRARLAAQYGRPIGLTDRLSQAILRVVIRLVGTRLLFDPNAASNLNVEHDGRGGVLLRQLTLRRRRFHGHGST